MNQPMPLPKALTQLRDNAAAASGSMDSIFHHSNARAYYICKTIFANREAILQTLRTFYVTLHAGLPPAAALEDEETCIRIMDAWLFNTCKHQLKEENPARFTARAEDAANAEKFRAKKSEEAAEPAKQTSATKKSKGSEKPKTADLDKKWLMQLRPEQRLLALMHNGCGIEPSEIAEQLRIPEDYVCGQLWQAGGSAAECAALAERLALKGGSLAKLNDETRDALLESIHAGLAERAATLQQTAPTPAEALVPDETPDATRLDTKRILRITGALAAVLVVIAFAAVAIGIKDKGLEGAQPPQDFDFESPYLSNVSDYAYSYTKKSTTTAEPIPPTYIIISQDPNLPTQPEQPATQPQQPVGTTAVPQPDPDPPATEPTTTTTTTTTTATTTTTTTATTAYVYTSKPTAPPTQPPDDDSPTAEG